MAREAASCRNVAQRCWNTTAEIVLHPQCLSAARRLRVRLGGHKNTKAEGGGVKQHGSVQLHAIDARSPHVVHENRRAGGGRGGVRGATTRSSRPRTAGARRSSTGARRRSFRTRTSRRGRVSPQASIFVSCRGVHQTRCVDGQGGQKKWQKWQKEKRALPGIPTWSPTVVLTGLDRA